MKLSQKKVKDSLIIVLILVTIPVIMGLNWTKSSGSSMAPTISDGDIVITIDSWSIKPGDVVLFLTPEWKKWPKEDQIWCKRIDHIKDDNKFWLLGDNSDDSYDSRMFGYVSRTNIYKKVICIIKSK